MFVIDSNHYIRALTDAPFAPLLRAFERTAGSRLRVSAVVVFEVLVGARDEREARDYERLLVAPLRGGGRLIVPGASTWRLVAATERALRAHGGYAASLAQRSFQNDMLLAASCREMGATLITANARDFAIIRTVLAFRYLTAFPAALTT